MDRDAEYDALKNLVRAMKGAQASMLLIMALSGRTFTKLELGSATAYSDKTVKVAVDSLARLGLVQQLDSGSWSLHAHFKKRLSTSLVGEEQIADQPVSALQAAGHDRKDSGSERNFSKEKPPKDSGSERNIFEGDRNSSGLDRNISDGWSQAGPIADRNISEGDRNYSEGDRNFSGLDRNFSEGDRNISDSNKDVVVVKDLEKHPDNNKQQQVRDRNNSDRGSELAALLGRIGVTGLAFEHLSVQPDLVADPDLVLAWWWHYLTQEWSERPAGAVIRRLQGHHDPPAGFLKLTRAWPGIEPEVKQEMEDKHWHGWSSIEMATYFAEQCPELTVEAFAAYIALYDHAAEELTIDD